MYDISDACISQIKYWTKALQESEKGHRRKNKKLRARDSEIIYLKAQIADLHVHLAELASHTAAPQNDKP